MIRRIAISAAGAVILFAASAHADETTCVAGREKAAGKYASCQSKAKVKGYSAGFAKCRIQYDGAWAKLKTQNPGTTCDTATRFVDNGDGTVTDRLTSLVWEKKTTAAGSGINPSDRHDVDNIYTWTNGDADETDEDGTVFTDFLADLNSGGGFAGANDWRLPTFQELQTILLPETSPCTASPCIVAELGADAASEYWSASTSAGSPSNARVFYTDGGYSGNNGKTGSYFVRAVRSGS